MKLYKNLTLMVLFGMTLVMLGMASAAYATSIDPTVILRGDGASMRITGLAFAGAFPTPTGAPFECTGGVPQNNCFQNANTFTFIAIHLLFNNTALTYTCDNSQDPFFTSCQATGNEVTFGGLGSVDSTNACDGDCRGIPGGVNGHFEIGINTNDMITYTGMAEKASSNTPEPASALLFVIAMGAIALFLKRA
jgi:hypothetical protein